MKISKAIFIALMSIGLSFNAYSDTESTDLNTLEDALPQDGKSTAAQVCMRLNFDSDKEKCMNIVRAADYFEINAVRFCGSKNFNNKVISCLSFISNKYFDSNAMRVCQTYSSFESKQDECVQAIANKRYEAYEINYCSTLNFDSRILQCMKDSGKFWTPTPPNKCNRDYIRRKIRDAIGDIDMGNPQRARLILNQLYYEL